MKLPGLAAAALAAFFLLGCPKPPITIGPERAEVEGLVVSLEVPKQSFVRGERFKLAVVAENTTSRAMLIEANTGAPVYVRLWRNVGLGWDAIKRYPRLAAMVMNPWKLQPGAQRRFELILTVEPDWPTGETLRLSAELNGRQDVRPYTEIVVLPPTSATE